MKLNRFRNAQQRVDFVKEHQTEIGALLDCWRLHDGHEITPQLKPFLSKVRAALGYSAKTIDIDIWRSIRKTYESVNQR